MEELDLNRSVFLFDLDGTLIDTTAQIVTALNKARLNLGFKDLSFSAIQSKIGLSANELFVDLDLSGKSLNEAVQLFRLFLANSELGVENVYQGVFELLSTLKSLECRLGVVTNKPRELALKSLKESKIDHFFELVVGSDFMPLKPNPEMLFFAKDFFGAPKAPTFMVGDRNEDVIAAKTASVFPIGVAQGVHSIEELIASGANLVFSSVAALHSFCLNRI